MSDCALAASWLAAVALHSAAWSVCALGTAALLRSRALAWQEALLRLALVGGLATGSLQWGLGGPIAGVPAFDFAPGAAAAPVGSEVPTTATPPRSDARHPEPSPAIAAAPLLRTPAGVAPARALVPAPAGPAATGIRHGESMLPAFAVGSALGTAVFGLGCFLLARRRLGQRLRGRVPEVDARVLALAAAVANALALRSVPRLSRHADLQSPLAFGLLRAEVCLPQRTGELGDDELRALFGHEFAHVHRGDAFWLLVGALAQALFPWQLWLVPVRRRLCEVAELRSDAVAARASSPQAVASCLVHVATWVGSARVPIGALAMAARPSLLRVRVENALADRGDRRPARAALAAAALAVAAALTAAVPGVRAGAAAPFARAGSAAIDNGTAVAPRPSAPTPRDATPDANAADPDDRAAVAPAAATPAAPAPSLLHELADLRAAQAALQQEAAALRTTLAGEHDAATAMLLELLELRLAAMAAAGERLELAFETWNDTTPASARRTR